VDDSFRNTYDDAAYADDYAQLEWTGTYHLIRRELPGILQQHVAGRRALDFGCGTGRSTRLLRTLGFIATGVDIAPSMIDRARRIDPAGDYVLLSAGDLERLPPGSFDLVLAAFPFDNTPAAEKPSTFRALARPLTAAGRIVNIVSTPELYTHEWVSFSTRDFPGNRTARNGDLVRSLTTQFRNGRPADDVLCTEEGYREIFRAADLEVEALYKPLGKEDDGFAWVTETDIAPWAIYVLTRTKHHTAA
jgi:ubiquinone/menaquinone biosynthesis C-methylase UbiE